MTDKTQTFQATLMHAPILGTLETIEDALVNVAADGKILAVLRPDEPDYEPALRKAEDGGTLHSFEPGHYLLPGLVDLHIHAPQWPMMGKSLHLPLYEWLEQHTFPLEARYADVDFAQEVYSSLVDTLLANGTTTAVYFGTIHNPANHALAEICLDRGQRAFVGKVAMDDIEQCPDYYRDLSAAAAINETKELIEFIRQLPGNETALVKPIVTPRFIPSCTDELLAGLGALARETDCHIQTHCSESDWQHAFVKQRCGKNDATALRDFGLLTRKTVLAHSNHITDDDCETIKAAG
ncbi:amidohydrolase family protein, partial [Alphaproteobacteria bacterium]|nr:amidohydrolase family protein [Alphaproteobacteria bacterium]